MTSLTHLAVAASALMVLACTADTLPDKALSSASHQEHSPPRSQSGMVRPPTPASAEPYGPAVPRPLQASVLVADQLQLYLDRVPGKAVVRSGWRDHIHDVTVGLQIATIHTDLASDGDDLATARQICLLVSWFKHSPEGRHVTSLDVEVYGDDGALLARHEDTLAQSSTRAGAFTRRSPRARMSPAGIQTPVAPTPRLPSGSHRES